MSALLDKARVEIKLGQYGVAPATALNDPGLLPRVQEYRRITGSRMYPLDKEDIHKRIVAADYHVSRKVDGEFTVLVYRDGEALTLNPGGTVRVAMPWLDEAAKRLSRAGVKEALVAGELYVSGDGQRRPRVHDVTRLARQPRAQEDLDRLRFAVFDIVSLDGNPPSDAFADTWTTIRRLFDDGDTIRPVDAKAARDADDVARIFEQWVEGEGAEGIVVRGDTAGTFKIKPRHTLDAAVIGFTESIGDRRGMLHDLLLAVMRPDGSLQVLSRVGGGFSDEQRRDMISDLKDMTVESEYAEVNSDHVAYQMVEPEWVVEISCLDLISQTTRGGTVNRMVLDFRDEATRYDVVRRLPLAAVISPQFVRRREDKSVTVDEVRIEQITELVEVPLADRDARQMTLPKTELLRREVHTKQLKGQTMVRKFVMLKTNKETESDEYPAYVVHYTDFSPNRAAPLARDVRISSSLDQIRQLWDGMKEANIKKGWDIHHAGAADSLVAGAADRREETPATDEGDAKKTKKKVKSKEKEEVASPRKTKKAKSKPATEKKMAPSARQQKTDKKKTRKKSG